MTKKERLKQDLSKTIKDPPKETQADKIFRVAFEAAMEKKYGNKPETPPDIPIPKPESPQKPPPKVKPEPPKAKPEPPPETTPTPKPEPVKQVGIEIINNTNRSFWKDQNISTIKLQCELRGKRFTDLETKGSNRIVNGKNLKVKRMQHADYLVTLYKLLKI